MLVHSWGKQWCSKEHSFRNLTNNHEGTEASTWNMVCVYGCVCIRLQCCIRHSQGSLWEQSGCWGGDSWCGLNQTRERHRFNLCPFCSISSRHTHTHAHSLLEPVARVCQTRKRSVWRLSFPYSSLQIFNTFIRLSHLAQPLQTCTLPNCVLHANILLVSAFEADKLETEKMVTSKIWSQLSVSKNSKSNIYQWQKKNINYPFWDAWHWVHHIKQHKIKDGAIMSYPKYISCKWKIFVTAAMKMRT